MPQAPVLDGQPHFHHPHKELGEMHLTELKVKALHVTTCNTQQFFKTRGDLLTSEFCSGFRVET